MHLFPGNLIKRTLRESLGDPICGWNDLFEGSYIPVAVFFFFARRGCVRRRLMEFLVPT